MPRGPARSRRRLGPPAPAGLLVLAALAVGALTASVVVAVRSHPRIETSPPAGLPAGAGARLPGAGAPVPAFDLASDPVFVTLSVGYAIEEHSSGGVVSEHLARTVDGGRRWYLVGSPFPFANDYSEVEFMSLESGYAFGPAGLAVTHDGGRHWVRGATLGGSLERVVPIGEDVWATYAVCHGPPVATAVCTLRIAISRDGGLTWRAAPEPSPIHEARAGGDILARDTLDKAYVVTYGPTGGGLAVTSDDGASWQRLVDPCARWYRADMAALSDGDLWMICGGEPVLGGTASAKAVFRSYDGGGHWLRVAATGFGPGSPVSRAVGPTGELAYAGQLSQLATISPTRAWIGVTGVGILVTFDGGRRWHVPAGITDHGGDTGVGVTFNDSVHGWAIEFHEAVFRTDDALHWTVIDGR